MSFKNLTIKLRSTNLGVSGRVFFIEQHVEHALSVGPTDFGNMQLGPGTALRGLRVDGGQVLVLEVLHDLLGQLCQHSFGQCLLGGLQAKRKSSSSTGPDSPVVILYVTALGTGLSQGRARQVVWERVELMGA